MLCASKYPIPLGKSSIISITAYYAVIFFNFVTSDFLKKMNKCPNIFFFCFGARSPYGFVYDIFYYFPIHQYDLMQSSSCQFVDLLLCPFYELFNINLFCISTIGSILFWALIRTDLVSPEDFIQLNVKYFSHSADLPKNLGLVTSSA